MGVSLDSEMNQGSEYYLFCSKIIALVYFLVLSLKCIHDASYNDFALWLYSEVITLFELFPPNVHAFLKWKHRSCLYAGATQKCSAMMFRCSIWHLLPWLLLYTHLWPCDALQHDVLYWFHHWRSNAWPALNVSHMFICTPCNHSSVSYHPLCCKSIGTNTNTTRQALHTRTTCIINLNHVWPISDKTFARNPNGIRGVGLACCHCRMNVDERELYCLFVLILTCAWYDMEL